MMKSIFPRTVLCVQSLLFSVLISVTVSVPVMAQGLVDELFIGLFENDASRVETALKAGADPNASYQDSTPLHFAVQFGRSDAIKLLLQFGADPTLEIEGKTAEQLAIEQGREEIAQLIVATTVQGSEREAPKLDRGIGSSDVEKVVVLGDATIGLFDALAEGDVNEVRAALRAGADPNAIVDGATPLRVAVIRGQADAFHPLFEAGAKPIATGTRPSVMDLALGSNNRALVTAFIDSAPTRILQAEVDDAADRGDREMVLALLNVEIAPSRSTARDLAISSILAGDDPMLKALLKNGLAPDTVNEGSTLLGLAISAQDPLAVEELLAAGADPNKESDGMQPLSMAAVASVGLARQVIEAGASIDRITDRGVRAALLALTGEDRDLAAVLELSASGAAKSDAGDLLAAIEADDAAAFRRALETVNINGRTPDGTPYLHHVIANTRNLALLEATFVARPDIGMTGPHNTNLVDALLAALSEEIRRTANRYAYNVNRSKYLEAWVHENADGISGLNRWLFSRSSDRDITRVGGPAMKEIFTQPDSAGFMPIEVAVLFGDAPMTRLMVNALDGEIPNLDPSLQDRARASGNWDVLAALPYDRIPPASFLKGATTTAHKDMQSHLRDWGYYTGKIDGVLGEGSRAALKAYLADAEHEIINMINSVERSLSDDTARLSHEFGWYLVEAEVRNREDGDTILQTTVPVYNGPCDWRYNRWKGGDIFIGCVRRNDKPWNANGFAKYSRGDGSYSIRLFGPNGWEDDVILR